MGNKCKYPPLDVGIADVITGLLSRGRKRSWEGRWTGGAAGEEWVFAGSNYQSTRELLFVVGQRTCGTTESLGRTLAWGRSGRVGGSERTPRATVDGWSGVQGGTAPGD